ncbi:putative sulfate adenylyltransferase, small subunit [Candidatus Zinderia insecticola CARI]|uniref:Sulfate adenylyltransferase subunit 2 n=1 Tax=Zinderia insecticola (strain CARI) TaxID=871271 RepID=E0TIX5_ZINIC|nr:putative sulfate adenylyltransferase, small subunit [Candidatus Zinderia insecticola CARI]
MKLFKDTSDEKNIKYLESESINIIREVASQCNNPVLLFSGGKDSIVLLKILEKSFWPNSIPFKVLHIDTGFNFKEVIFFRNKIKNKLKENFIIRNVEDTIKKNGLIKSEILNRNKIQSITLLEAIKEFNFDVCLGGARRDEEKSRAKERIFSFRDKLGRWNPKKQRPELWNLYNSKIKKKENIRIFPISNWTELDIWKYIYYEKINIPSIYLAHKRKIIIKNGSLISYKKKNYNKNKDIIKNITVRFRTVGDINCTCPIISNANTLYKIIKETLILRSTERGFTRIDDSISESAMEKRKKEGYF